MQKPSKLAQIPQIRFAGFTEDWERRKLIDYLDVSRNKNKEEIFGKEDVLSVSGDYGIVNQIEFQGRSFAGVSVVNYGVVDSGDVVYTKSPLKLNPYGIIKTNKGKPGIVSTLYAVYKPKDNVYSEFIQIYFEQDARMNNYMHPLVNKGAKNDMKVSDENVLQGEVCFPEREEQEKISTYFQSLDNLITLHQSKFEKLQKIKKSCLQNLFPQNNQNTPKIRFKNFTDEWVESRLGELGETYSGLSGKTKNDFGRGNAKYITYLNVFSNSIADIKLTEPIEKDEKQNQVKFGDVLFTTSSETPNEVGMSSVWLGNFQNCYLNSFCFGYRLTQKINHYYLAYLLRSENIRNKIILLAQGISRYNISKNKMMDISISIPNSEEQEKIGAFFSKLDKLITLQQRKVEKLKNIKKALLNKMFI
ncbi:restriction endonuclease subunit S [Campylobacter vicugnae]|uniref:restriction endonuclease subunit S n=1 Tax=Campylobacter vicugnae TaxID=1660076 RepID=UPI00254F1BDF|nr:restriction endonuclease subunit S [Campylobacter ovis]MDL0104348.1 restriction endonuclease subunit S [Campylobacter ovis]MDL0106473.1 restriction endonuclease subunit S [Campylobacter ovis]